MSQRMEKQVSVRVPPEMVALIDKWAARRRVKRADVIRDIIWEKLDATAQERDGITGAQKLEVAQ
jgi:Arc/MetJ-type ribon-helix-helix transcriptional regulator